MTIWLKPRPGVFCALCILVAGCGSDPGFNERTAFTPGEGDVQFVNMWEDSPQVVIFHGISQTVSAFPFASPVERRPVDNYDWRIVYLDSDDTEVTAEEGSNQRITDDVLSTFLLTGSIAAQPRVQVIDMTIVPTVDRPEDTAAVWFASNFSSPAMVDIYVTAQDDSLADSEPLVTLAAGGTTDVVSTPAGEGRQLRVTPAGATDLLFDSGPINLVAAQVQELFALIDDLGPDGDSHVDVIRAGSGGGTTLVDVSQTAHVRVANFSTQDAVTFALDMTQLGDSLDSKAEWPDYISVEPGTKQLTLSADSVELENREQEISPGHFQTIIAFDNEAADSQPAARSIITTDVYRPITDYALFRLVNGSTESVSLYVREDDGSLAPDDASLDDATRIFDGLASFGVSDTVAAELGMVRFIITHSDESTSTVLLDAGIEEGRTYTLVYDTAATLTLQTN